MNYTIETDIELTGLDSDNTFEVLCFDGYGIATNQNNSDEKYTLLYPKLKDLTKKQIENIKEYCFANISETIDFGSIMKTFGKIKQ